MHMIRVSPAFKQTEQKGGNRRIEPKEQTSVFQMYKVVELYRCIRLLKVDILS